jgi:hypothetical protein
LQYYFDMKKDDEPKLWVTVLKLVVGLVVIIGSVGLALYLALQREQLDGLAPGTSGPSWGIVNDNPLRQRR